MWPQTAKSGPSLHFLKRLVLSSLWDFWPSGWKNMELLIFNFISKYTKFSDPCTVGQKKFIKNKKYFLNQCISVHIFWGVLYYICEIDHISPPLYIYMENVKKNIFVAGGFLRFFIWLSLGPQWTYSKRFWSLTNFLQKNP